MQILTWPIPITARDRQGQPFWLWRWHSDQYPTKIGSINSSRRHEKLSKFSVQKTLIEARKFQKFVLRRSYCFFEQRKLLCINPIQTVVFYILVIHYATRTMPCKILDHGHAYASLVSNIVNTVEGNTWWNYCLRDFYSWRRRTDTCVYKHASLNAGCELYSWFDPSHGLRAAHTRHSRDFLIDRN
jgi:hypothetical protein